MFESSYQLTYAGIPFIGDAPKAIRLPGPTPRGEGGSEQLLPNRKEQPLSDLIDELNRVIPWQYLQDQLPYAATGRTVDALAIKEPSRDGPVPDIRIGDWWYPNTACRWGVFRGLATSSEAKAMLAATAGRKTAPFVMKCAPKTAVNSENNAAPYSLSSSLYMLPPRPLGETGGGTRMLLGQTINTPGVDGLYLVTLVDERYYWQGTPASFKVTSTTVWTDLIAQLASALGVAITVPSVPAAYLRPEQDSQLWASIEDANVLLDAVAANLGSVVVRRLNGTYLLQTPADAAGTVAINRGGVAAGRAPSPGNAGGFPIRIAGGNMFEGSGTRLPVGNLLPARNSVLPFQVTVGFPKYIAGQDPVPHFFNPRYAAPRPSAWYEDSYGEHYWVSVPLASGGPLVSGLSGTVTVEYLRDTAKALYSGEGVAVSGRSLPLNQAGLYPLAQRLAQDYWEGQVAAALDEVYPGTFAWTPEAIHDIVWTYSERVHLGATRVMRSEWNLSVKEFQHSTPPDGTLTQSPAVPGVGGPSVAQTVGDSYSGTIIAPPLAADMQAGDTFASLTGIANLPTQNRWKGVIDRETILFEGTSGSHVFGVVFRGIDGSLPANHAAGTPVILVQPDRTYGVNLLRHEKGQWVYPGAWTSGGITEARIIPQSQNVLALSDQPLVMNGTTFYSGLLTVSDPPKPGPIPFVAGELVWLYERNQAGVVSGRYYDGTFMGFSPEGGAGTGCCDCSAYFFVLFGLSPGCNGNGSYTLAYSGTPCVWAGTEPETGSTATLTFPAGAGAGAAVTLRITTAGGCTATYFGTADTCDNFTLQLPPGAGGETGTGWPDVLNVSCLGHGSGGGGGVVAPMYTVSDEGQEIGQTCPSWTFFETDVRCEAGYATGGGTGHSVINVYRRYVTLSEIGGCLYPSYGDWFYYSTQGCCDCPGTSTGDCCKCLVYCFVLAGLSPGCDGNDSYALNFSNPCAWSGVGANTGSAARLEFPAGRSTGVVATLTVTTAGGCQASYSGVVSDCNSFVLGNPNVIAGTGWPASVTINCCGSTSTGTGTGPCVPGVCPPCVDPPFLYTVGPVAGFTGNCKVFNGTWRLIPQAQPCRWAYVGVLDSQPLTVVVTVGNTGETLTFTWGPPDAPLAQAVYAAPPPRNGDCCRGVIFTQQPSSECSCGGVGPCPSCAQTPATVTFDGTGLFTGDFAAFAQKWVMPYDGPCEWLITDLGNTGVGAISNVAWAAVSIGKIGDPNYIALQLSNGVTGAIVAYRGTLPPTDCCDPVSLALFATQDPPGNGGGAPLLVDVTFDCSTTVLGSGDCPISIPATPSCCTTSTGTGTGTGCTYRVTATLNWDPASQADLDLYVKDGATGDVCWYGSPAAGALGLNHDAFPECAAAPAPPEIITGNFAGSRTFKAWYNQWSDCATPTNPSEASFNVANTGTVTIVVTVGSLNITIPPGGNSDVLVNFAYAGYNTRDQRDFPGGTPVIVTCGVPTGTGMTGTGMTGTGMTGTGMTGTGMTGTGTGTGPGVTVPCCPGVALPLQMTVAFSNTTGTCGCLPAAKVMTYAGLFAGMHVWQYAPVPGSCADPVITLTCNTSTLQWRFTIDALTPQAPSFVRCSSPFLLIFSINSPGGYCVGTFDVSITS